MWLFNFLPNYIFDVLLFIGIIGIAVGFIVKSVPFISKYMIAILSMSICITSFATWHQGRIAREAEYNAAIEEMKLKIAESEKKAAEANAKIEYIFIDRIQPIRDVQVVIQEKIKNVAVTIDSNCKITADTIDILNNAAQKPGSKR